MCYLVCVAIMMTCFLVFDLGSDTCVLFYFTTLDTNIDGNEEVGEGYQEFKEPQGQLLTKASHLK